MDQIVFNVVSQLLVTLFGVSKETITHESTQKNVDGWDSLGQLRLFLALEEHYGMSFLPEEIYLNNTVAKIIKLIESKKK